MGMLTQHSFTTTFVLNRNGPVYTTFCPKVIDSQRAPMNGRCPHRGSDIR